MSRRDKNVGRWGEDQACFFLERNGFSIIDRNFYTKKGEIDIVARHSGVYFFIEVKTRFSEYLVASNNIGYRQHLNLENLARFYLYKKSIENISWNMAGLTINVNKRESKLKFFYYLIYELGIKRRFLM